MHRAVTEFMNDRVAREPITEKSAMPDVAWYLNYNRFAVVASKAGVSLHFVIGDDLKSKGLDPFDRPDLAAICAVEDVYVLSVRNAKVGAQSRCDAAYVRIASR